MASQRPLQQTTCAIHTDKKAHALCLKHYELLCLQCVIDKANTGDCHITEIQDNGNERVHCILEHLCARETVTRLQENTSRHISKTHEIKERLLQEVSDLHQEYTSRLEEKTQACKTSIQEKADHIENAISSENKFLNDREMQLASNLENLKDEDVSLNECIEQLTTIQADLSKESNEKMSEPEGSFNPDEKLRENLREQCLGLVQLVHQKHYEVIGDAGVDNIDTQLPEDQNTPDDVYDEVRSGSDIYYSTVKAQSVKPDDKKHKGRWRLRDLLRWPGKGDKHETSSNEASERESTTTLQTKQTRVSESVHASTEGIAESKFNLESLVDKALKIPDVKKAQSKPALKFTKVIHFDDHLDKNWFGFLADSTVLVTQFPKGPTIQMKFPNQVCSIAPIGPREIAVLIGQQITSLGIQNERLTTLGAYVVHETITDLTGFDFDVKSSRYAVGTMSKVMFLDKKGTMIKTCTIEQTMVDALHFKSVFDFNSDHVLYLNIESRTLKSLTCKADKAKVIWKKKFAEEKSLPKDICIYNDICFVACTSSIAAFSKTDGKPVAVHDTYDILPDCLAVCVTEGIALWTSDSDGLHSSTHIGCIAL